MFLMQVSVVMVLAMAEPADTSSFPEWTSEDVEAEEVAEATEAELAAAKSEAERYKMVGNVLFRENRFEEAGNAYTQAIKECNRLSNAGAIDTLHVYFCNRALTSIKMENFGRRHS